MRDEITPPFLTPKRARITSAPACSRRWTMGRRSLIYLDIESREGVLENVRVTGGCVEFMRGSISL